MIIAHLSDPLLRSALRRAARPDEDVVWSPDLVELALDRGFPRLVVRVPEDARGRAGLRALGSVPELTLTRAMLQAWESERKSRAVPPPRVELATVRLRVLIRDYAAGPSWVDRTLADLSRAAGAPLPRAFSGLGRRVLEFPAHYSDLHPLSDSTGLSRGALKARFRRRDLASPTTWVRWFRVLAAAHLLADRSVSTLDAAHRLGLSGSGNLCRLVQDVSGLTTTEIREPAGRQRVMVAVAAGISTPARRERWNSLDQVLLQRA